MKIKKYILRILIDESDDEILHLSESYDCDEQNDTYRLEIMGVEIDIPIELQQCLEDLDSDVLGLT